MSNLQQAIQYFGTQAKLAQALDIGSMAITQWKHRGVPPMRAKQIERLSNGNIKASLLRPDIFD